MKLTVRVPTQEYGYAEVEMEVPDDMTAQEVATLYQETADAFKPQAGLEKKEWNRILDQYLNKGGMTSDEGSVMSKEQQWLIHELDKAFARIIKKE
jgi:hypothetical protein